MNTLIKFITKPIIYTIISYILLSPISPAIQIVNAKNRANESSITNSGSELSNLSTNYSLLNTNNDTGTEIPHPTHKVSEGIAHPSPIEFGTQEIEVCFLNLDEKGQVLENLPRAVEFEFPIYTNPNVNKNTGLPDAYVESGSELNNSNTIKFNIDEETGNNEIIWTHSTSSGQANSGKNDAYCETREITVPIDTERKTYGYGEMTITDPLNDWFDTRYHDGYQEEFTHPKYAEKYSAELFELDEDGNHIPNPDKHHGGDHNERDNLSDGHINLYGANDERRIVIVNKIKKRVLPKVIEVCFVTVDHYGNFIDGTKIEDSRFRIRLNSDIDTDNKGYPVSTFGANVEDVYLTSPYSNNTNHFNTDDEILLASESGSELPEEEFNDAHCKEVEFLTKNTHFSYSQLHIDSTEEFEAPKYTDQPGKYIKSIYEFTEYSHELFDSIEGNEENREKNSDGHIVIRENEDPRRLMVMVKLIDNPHKMKIDVIDKYGNDVDGLEDDPANSISQTPAEYLDYDANESKKQIRYEVINNDPEEIKYVRFSWDGFNWKTIPNLPTETWCPNFVTECNIWDGSAFTEDLFKFEKEKKETRFVEITDDYGNIRIEKLDIVFDMTNPAGEAHFFHGSEPYDTVNTDYVYERTSHTTYMFKDSTTSLLDSSTIALGDTSGIYKIRFGYENDETTMNSWVDYFQGELETTPHSWVKEIKTNCPDEDVPCDLDLDVYAQVMDRAGNISPIYHDRIIYRNYKPAPKVIAHDTYRTINGINVPNDQVYVELFAPYHSNDYQLWTIYVDMPQISFSSYEIVEENGKEYVVLSGRGLKKEAIFHIFKGDGTCGDKWWQCTENEVKYRDLDHAGITIFESKPGKDDEVGFDWVNGDGTWQVKIELNGQQDLNKGDLVYAEGQIWDTYPGFVYPEIGKVYTKLKYANDSNTRKTDYTQVITIADKSANTYDDNRNTGNNNVNKTGIKLHGDPNLNGMDDVPTTNVFFDYIKNLINDDVVSGYPDGSFKPDDNVTRGQMAKFIVNGFGINVNDCSNSQQFDDVTPNHTFYAYINTMKCAGISDGASNGFYYPDDNLKRGEAAKLIVRALEYKHQISLSDYFNTYHNYTDVTGNVFEEYIGYLFNTKTNGVQIMKGYSHIGGNRPFGPNDNITRGQMAKIIDLGRQFGFDDMGYDLGTYYSTSYEFEMCGDRGSIGYYEKGEVHIINGHSYILTGKAYEKYVENGGFSTFGFLTQSKTKWSGTSDFSAYVETGYIYNFTNGLILDGFNTVESYVNKQSCNSYYVESYLYEKKYGPTNPLETTLWRNQLKSLENGYWNGTFDLPDDQNDAPLVNKELYQAQIQNDINVMSMKLALAYIRVIQNPTPFNKTLQETLNTIIDEVNVYYTEDYQDERELILNDFRITHTKYAVDEIYNIVEPSSLEEVLGRLTAGASTNPVEFAEGFVVGIFDELKWEIILPIATIIFGAIATYSAAASGLAASISAFLASPVGIFVIAVMLIVGGIILVTEAIDMVQNYDMLVYLGQVEGISIDGLNGVKVEFDSGYPRTVNPSDPFNSGRVVGRGLTWFVLAMLTTVTMYKTANDFVGILKNIEADPNLIKNVAKNADEAAKDGGKKPNLGVGNPGGNKLMTEDDFYKFLDDIGSPDKKLSKWNKFQSNIDQVESGLWDSDVGLKSGLHDWNQFQKAVSDGKIIQFDDTLQIKHSTGVREVIVKNIDGSTPKKTFFPESFTRYDYEQIQKQLATPGEYIDNGKVLETTYKGITVNAFKPGNPDDIFKHFWPVF